MDRTDLQHDAFKLNGEYLEDLISGYVLSTDTAVNSGKVYFSLSGGKYTKVTPVGTENPTTSGWYEKDGYGYTTYKAVGRESLEKDIDSYENGTDGETLKRSRFPKRNIEISFIVHGDSLADLRDKMHKLQTALNVENAEIIFNDDASNYYTATPVIGQTVSEAKNAASGTYNLVCHDPFKYSKTLTTVETTTYTETITDEDGNTSSVTSQVLTTNNTGGYKTYPAFQVQFATDEEDSELGTDADCGYVLFAKGGTDYSVQIGDDQEKDIVTHTNINHVFAANKKGGFTDTNTITPLRDTWAYNGSSKATAKGLMINATTNVSKKFHGPMSVYTAPTGYHCLGEFTVTWKQVVSCHSKTATGKKQCGCLWIMLLDNSNNVLFGYGVEKSNTTKLTGNRYVYDYVNGIRSSSCSFVYTSSMGHKNTSDTTGRLATCSIKRKLTYDDQNVLTDCRTIIHDPWGTEWAVVEDEPAAVYKVAFFFGKYASAAALYSERVTQVSFINGGVDEVNTFGSGDYVEVDCSKAEITMNTKNADSLGDVGNDWEDMYLDVGTNTMYVQYSPWITSGYEPTVTMTYRKRWL